MLIISKCTCTLALVIHSFPLTYSAQSVFPSPAHIYTPPSFIQLHASFTWTKCFAPTDSLIIHVHHCFPRWFVLCTLTAPIYKAQVVLQQHQTRNCLFLKDLCLFCLLTSLLEGKVHTKMKMMSLITHPHVVPNQQGLRPSSEHKWRYVLCNPRALWPLKKITNRFHHT